MIFVLDACKTFETLSGDSHKKLVPCVNDFAVGHIGQSRNSAQCVAKLFGCCFAGLYSREHAALYVLSQSVSDVYAKPFKPFDTAFAVKINYYAAEIEDYVFDTGQFVHIINGLFCD